MKTLLATGLAALALAATARAEVIVHGPAKAAKEVIAAEHSYSKLFAEVGIAKGFKSFLDPKDGLAFTGAGDPVHAEAAFKAFGSGAPGAPTLSWEPAEVFVSASGDMAASWGHFTLTAPNQKPGHGRYVTVWRRPPGGKWLALMDIGEPDPPAKP